MAQKRTTTQIWIMRELNKPQGRAHLHRPDGFAFISNKSLSAQTVRAASLFALQEAGVIEDVTPADKRWRGSTYKLTRAGKTELRALDLSEDKKRKRGQ